MLLESCGAEFTAYQLDGTAKQWWQTYGDTRPANVMSVTWVQFIETFMTRFVSKSFKDRQRGLFIRLEKGQITMNQYVARFQELSQYTITILPTEDEQIHYFVHRLRPQFKIHMHSLVKSIRSYLDIIDHARSLEQFSHEAQGGSHKCNRHEEEFSSPDQVSGCQTIGL